VKESAMRKSITRKILKELPHSLVQPIESGGTSLGIPDIYFKTVYSEGWIELKQFMFRNNHCVYIPFRPGQIAWINNYLSLHGNIAILGTFTLNKHTRDWQKLWIIIKNRFIKEVYTYEEFLTIADVTLLEDINIIKMLRRK